MINNQSPQGWRGYDPRDNQGRHLTTGVKKARMIIDGKVVEVPYNNEPSINLTEPRPPFMPGVEEVPNDWESESRAKEGLSPFQQIIHGQDPTGRPAKSFNEPTEREQIEDSEEIAEGGYENIFNDMRPRRKEISPYDPSLPPRDLSSRSLTEDEINNILLSAKDRTGGISPGFHAYPPGYEGADMSDGPQHIERAGQPVAEEVVEDPVADSVAVAPVKVDEDKGDSFLDVGEVIGRYLRQSNPQYGAAPPDPYAGEEKDPLVSDELRELYDQNGIELPDGITEGQLSKFLPILQGKLKAEKTASDKLEKARAVVTERDRKRALEIEDRDYKRVEKVADDYVADTGKMADAWNKESTPIGGYRKTIGDLESSIVILENNPGDIREFNIVTSKIARSIGEEKGPLNEGDVKRMLNEGGLEGWLSRPVEWVTSKKKEKQIAKIKQLLRRVQAHVRGRLQSKYAKEIPIHARRHAEHLTKVTGSDDPKVHESYLNDYLGIDRYVEVRDRKRGHTRWMPEDDAATGINSGRLELVR